MVRVSALTIEPEAIRAAATRLSMAIDHLRRLRSTPSPPNVLVQVAEAQRAAERLSQRMSDILTSPLLLEPEQRDRRLVSTIDEWISDRKWWARSTTRASTPIDPVVTLMARDAETRSSLLDSLVDSDPERLSALLFGATNFTDVRTLWMRAVDPASTTPYRARRRIEAFAAAVFDEPRARETITGASLDVVALRKRRDELRELLGAMAAPWVLHFTGLAGTWGGDATSGSQLLRRIADVESAATHLRDGLGPALERAFHDLPPTHEQRMTRIDEIAFGVGATTEVLRRARVAEAEESAANRSAILSVPGQLPLGMSWSTGLMIGVATSVLSHRLDDTREVADRSARLEHSDREELAALAEHQAELAAVEDGLMDPDAIVVPAEVRLQMQHARDSIANAAERGDVFVGD